MQYFPKISTCSIVLIGHFNPAIFHPSWLKARKIESENTQVDDFKNFSLKDQFTQFSIESRFYSVQADRFMIETSSAPWVKILDISTKIFSELLPHTPITAFGINRIDHFELPDFQSRNKLGRKLAPIAPWGEFGQEMETKELELTGGLLSLTMQKKSRSEGNYMETNVTIEPSKLIDSSRGVYMMVNTHKPLNNLPSGHGSDQGINMLASCFDKAIEEAELIINNIWNLGINQ